MLLLLEDRDITVMEETPVTRVTDEGVEVRLSGGKLWGIEADLVIYAAGIKPAGQIKKDTGPSLTVMAKTGLVPALSMKAEEVHVIGDCSEVGRILEATRAGERIGRWL